MEKIKNACFMICVLSVAALIQSCAPKRDYSHVPPEHRNLVKFAESAGY